MRKTKRSFYVNELYDDKLKMIQRNNNISTLSSSIVFLIDYYIKNENKKDEIKEDCIVCNDDFGLVYRYPASFRR